MTCLKKANRAIATYEMLKFNRISVKRSYQQNCTIMSDHD